MPFKLKLKKTRQYNVASKSLFVISVELLDGGVADCTLSVDSTGQECLDNVCQRQAITQPEFFGLRYMNRSQQARWVQLERPLKRQLEKYASSHQLYLRVMYYVISGTSLITDEVTRYHYFLQLKNDLVEGRIICDCQQAVVLASYSRQAEYGNHDRERHTVDYLKNLLTFPKQILDGGQLIDGSMLAETGRLEWLTEAVIQHHMALHNMSQAQAEEGFITTCQQLRGYGQEMFTARDQLSQGEVTVAISLTGIRVLMDNSDTPHLYRWMDITNVINHKRTFSIECQKQSLSTSFTLPSPEDGKYVWWLCVQQHTFYMKHQGLLSETVEEHRPKFQDHGLSESREDLVDCRSEALTRSTSCLDLAEHPPHMQNRALLPSYRPAPDYETAIQQKYQQQRAEAQLRYQNHTQISKPLLYGSHPDVHRVHYPDVTRHTLSNQGLTDDYYGLKLISNYPFAVNPNVQTDLNQLHYVNVYKPPPPYPSNGLASNSTPDLAVASQALNYHRGYINAHVSGSSPDLVSTRTALNRQYLSYVNPSHVNYPRPNIMPGTHGTYNNLNSVLDPKPHIIIDPHHISDNIQKVYDDRGNIMYSMPLHRLPSNVDPRYRHVVLPQSIKNDAQEPIYENVPLPWQNEGKVTMRDRAQSLTTTDEIARLNERNQPLKYQKPNLYSDSHYVNAQIIKNARENSVPKEVTVSTKSVNRDTEFENVALAIDRVSLNQEEKDFDETPYQSLSTHRVNNNVSKDNVTSIIVDPKLNITNTSISTAETTATSIGTSLGTSMGTSSSMEESKTKEKKRRRWGVFMGKGSKEVKSATLGRNKATPAPHTHRWSTGLPKFQPLPPSITKETMCQILERKMSDEQLAFAFEQIPKGRTVGAAVRTALLPQHAALNGHHSSLLPYEDNRVRLHPTPDNPHGYINASHITMTVGSTQRFYVIAGVPNVEGARGGATCLCGGACGALWRGALQVGAGLLAALAPHHYLPPDHTTTHYGQMSVTSGKSSVTAWGSSVLVRIVSGPRVRSLWHVHLATWGPHQHAPPLTHFLAFLSEINSLRLAHEADSSGGGPGGVGGAGAPIVFVCEAGAGRAGTALAAHLLHDILDNNQELDIPRTIGLLHQQRANLIQNVHQYKFLHQLLLLYLKQSRLI